MDELEAAGGLLHLVRLEVAYEMPSGSADDVHLRHRFLDAVLAEDCQAGIDRLLRAVGAETLGHGDDRDVVGVAAGLGDALADRLEVRGDAHRIATMAPKRAPSALRRCDGRKSDS